MPVSNVYLKDCMEGMKEFPDKFFDLAIVDPPYGLDSDSLNGRGKMKNRALNIGNKSWDIAPDITYFNELFRVSNNQIIWGGNYFNLFKTRCIICWDKYQPWENFSQWEYGWTSFDYPAKMFRFDNKTGNKIHPTQKPVKLYEWCLDKFAKVGDKILDTHLGSQSSRIAAYKLGFDFWGYEIDHDYFEQGNQRFEKESRLICHNDNLF
jgi:site-specific DNA-methyltransferase (adenine-specific)